MFKKHLTYTDYNGDTQTEDFYFNLNAAECMELQYGFEGIGTLTEFLETITETNDKQNMFAIIKRVLLMAYGIKSPDGKRFEKSDEIRKAFEESPAFETIYWEIGTNEEKGAEFILGILPSDVREKLGDNSKNVLLSVTE